MGTDESAAPELLEAQAELHRLGNVVRNGDGTFTVHLGHPVKRGRRVLSTLTTSPRPTGDILRARHTGASDEERALHVVSVMFDVPFKVVRRMAIRDLNAAFAAAAVAILTG